MASATPDLRLPSQPQGITTHCLVPNYCTRAYGLLVAEHLCSTKVYTCISGSSGRGSNTQSVRRCQRDGARSGQRGEAHLVVETSCRVHCPAAARLQGEGQSQLQGHATTSGEMTPCHSVACWYRFSVAVMRWSLTHIKLA